MQKSTITSTNFMLENLSCVRLKLFEIFFNVRSNVRGIHICISNIPIIYI